ncbi:4-hydroxyphenylpyruvate dioxygenase [Asticcacaulis benevestitus]|uniref:4-hydroxyphenylpyruvate dioxygenase n=1 Tax=Asticcacaulis benevestitus DSM 16100 = ATCC BAA-896 TaxID=1121022 RepID=V4Q9D8_9CAUL|nr:4-hydroxyphenylpyruvate dioxygenase [Asticcacaulis benevestitus]ESQ94480.1 4-hydroxyphenylpyruvate dioxygenase [Asticcacaulis benevestitus DSM 16100 = ATCC BAA-896]
MNDNPLGLNGFAFVEFTGPDTTAMARQLEMMGFVAASRHPERDIVRYKQGTIDFLINNAASPQAKEFAAHHGPSANGMGFRVADAAKAYDLALKSGAIAYDAGQGALGVGSYVLQGIGGSLLYLIDRDPYSNWIAIEGAAEAEAANSVGFQVVDHLTHNVARGQMRTWSSFYAQIFGFEEQKYFNIKGQATGLFSQAMIAPDGAIRIPLNESQDDTSQIEEYLRQYKGEGIQHIALTTDNIYATVEMLGARGVKLQDTIETYYDLVDKRVPGHGEDLQRLKANRILIDGDVESEGILLQIFTENTFGPIFFEVIQRKGNQGFGNGNFQALFESIELDQIRRGVIKVA